MIKAFQEKYLFPGTGLLKKGAADVLVQNTTSEIAGYFSTLNFTVGVTRNLTVETHANLYYHQKMLDVIEIYNHRYGLSLSDLPGVAWELTRLSWVIDWFWGVGRWLSAIKPNPRIDYLGNSVSQVLTEERIYSVKDPNSSGYPAIVISPAKYVWKSQSLVRVVNQPTPVLPAYNPDFFKIERSVDSICLLWQHVLNSLLSKKR